MKWLISKLGFLGEGILRDGNHSVQIVDGEYGLYIEKYFHGRLAFERKRAERSGRPFLLVLVDISAVSENRRGPESRKNLVHMLSSATRETDLKGWYRSNKVVGVIFSEVSETPGEALFHAIRHKLSACIPKDLTEKVMVSVHIFPEFKKDRDGGKKDLTLYPDLEERTRRKRIQFTTKRMIDIVGSIFGLTICAPLFVITALLVKFSSPGPLLFRQKRIGQYGRPFTVLKFRTMYVDNDPNIHKEYIRKFISEQKSWDDKGARAGAVFKIKDDPRVTKVGFFLRKTSLDELPQFINVLLGEMSLVGPRPPIPYELDSYETWHLRRIFEIKPGITGLWQVKGRSSTTFDEMVRLDLRYINGWSVGLDLRILFRTPWVVINGRGAY